jgi:hypothetical protein
VNVHNQQRYTSLTPLNRPDITDNKRGSDVRNQGRDSKKAVDPVWARKQETGPSARDLELLTVPDPLVTLNFRLDRSTAKGAGSNGWNGESSGSRGSGVLGGTSIGGAGRRSGTGAWAGGVEGAQGSQQSTAYIGGLMSSVDPVTLIPKFSIDIK